MKHLLASLFLLIFFLPACRPKDSGAWQDSGVVWSRQWGSGAVGAFSTVGLYKIDGDRIVKGPEVGSNDIEIKRRRNGDGTTDFIFYAGKLETTFRLDPQSKDGLTPFVMTSRNDADRFIIYDAWAGTAKALDVDLGMTAFPKELAGEGGQR